MAVSASGNLKFPARAESVAPQSGVDIRGHPSSQVTGAWQVSIMGGAMRRMGARVKARLQMADQGALSYLARRGVSPQWRGFVRALLDVAGTHLPEAGRRVFLRALGEGMAREMPLPLCATLAELEGAMNTALAAAEWGYVDIALDEANAALLLRHVAAPLIALPDDPAGAWIAPVLEGLYQAWLDAQPGAMEGVPVRQEGHEAGHLVLRYAQAA